MIVSTNQSLMDIDSIHKHDNHQITHFLGFFKHEKKSLIKKEKKNKLKSIMLALKFDEVIDFLYSRLMQGSLTEHLTSKATKSLSNISN